MNYRPFALVLLSTLALGQAGPENASAKPASAAVRSTEPTTDALAPGRALWKEHKYEEAAAAFKVVVDKNPSSADAQAFFLRSLLRAHKLDESLEAATKAVSVLPSSAAVHAAAGDVDFRMGKFSEAETEYRTALKLDGNSARGVLGMARMFDMVSLHKKAQDAFAKAHQLDSEDREIFEYWIDSLPIAQRLEELKKHGDDTNSRHMRYLSAIAQKKPWTLASELKPVTIKMPPTGREQARVDDIKYGNAEGARPVSKGFGVQVKFNDRATATLLLDTGAGGITIGRKLAEKAGVVKMVEGSINGIGDKGGVEGYSGWVDKINVGSLEFHDCVVFVSSRTDIADESGLIGADVFDKFLITLDFKNQLLQLSPLPVNPAAQGKIDDEARQDRYVAPEMQGFTKFYSFGKDIVVPVVVNDKVLGNFILDTGGDSIIITPRMASQVTKASYTGEHIIHGVSGNVDKVLTGNKAILTFAKMRIASHDLPVFNIDRLSDEEGTEIDGFVGIHSLVQMKMTIDYRDGLVNLEPYEFRKATE